MDRRKHVSRDWSALPDLALLTILSRLPAVLDLFAFAAACRSWRSVLTSSSAADYPLRRPPLLLRPILPPFQSRPPHFDLQTLDLPSHHRSLLPLQSLTPDLCLGLSRGRLILLRRNPLSLVLTDALTAVETPLPPLPSDRYPYYYAASAAAADSSTLLLFYSKYAFLALRNGAWSTYHLGPHTSFIVRILPFKGRLYALNDQAHLFLFDFGSDSSIAVRLVQAAVAWPKDACFDRWHIGPQLVDCDGELLLILFMHNKKRNRTHIRVFQMDFGRMEWVAVESLRDYALFIDCGGKCPVACSNPGSWGGRGNCVYLASPGFDSWEVFRLDGKNLGSYFRSSSLYSEVSHGPRWPSPVWIYPSLFSSS